MEGKQLRADHLRAALIDSMREYLYLPDPDHVMFCLGVAASTRLDGDPLWGLLVGASSSGKTEAIRVLDDVADEHLTEITAAGLLSWIGGKRQRRIGLLARVGEVAFATIADLSTLLAASDRGQRDMLFALLRRAYDGEVTRELGNAPEPLRWAGRLTLLAAVTPAVDNYSSHANALGPRWLCYRLRENDTEARRLAGRKARESAPHLKERRRRARELARLMVDDAADRARSFDLAPSVADAIDDAALVACLGRASVEREGYGKREIRSIPVIEEPPRLAGQLSLLARCLLGLGLDDVEATALCRRAALDSIPQARRRVLATLAAGEELLTAEVARRVGCDRKVALFALEELDAVGVCRYRGADSDADEPTKARKWWRLDGDDARLVTAVLVADERSGTKSVSLPPNPPVEGQAVHSSSDLRESA